MDGTPLYPVVLKDAAFRPPEASTYYLVAANGFYFVRRTELFSATVRVEGGVPGLLPHESRLVLSLPRLPARLLEEAVGFFRAVHARWEGEAIVVIFYRPPAEGRSVRFAVTAPPQLIRGRFERGRFRADLRLDYRACAKPGPAWRKLGTIHSHANLGPRHSATDEDDEVNEAGLHVTVGYVDSNVPEFAAAFVVGRTRFPLPPETVLQPFQAARPWPPAWMQRVTVACESWSSAARTARVEGEREPLS